PNGRHEDTFFLDPANGWLINGRGEVHRTEDGGATWTQLAQLTDSGRTIVNRCLGFASTTRGWIGNLNTTAGGILPNASLFETTDGGRPWSNISPRLSGPTVVGPCGMAAATAGTLGA